MVNHAQILKFMKCGGRPNNLNPDPISFEQIRTTTTTNASSLLPVGLNPPDCYHYQRVETGSLPVALGGPDARHSSCLWHLQAAPGSQLEVSVEWPLPSCGDQLLLYDALTPSPSQLITS